MVIAGLSQHLCSGSSNWKHMALSPLSRGLFSWSHVTYTIRDLAVTPLEEARRAEMRKRGGRVMLDDCLD